MCHLLTDVVFYGGNLHFMAVDAEKLLSDRFRGQ